MGINFDYAPGQANALSNQYDASVQNRNLLAQQALAQKSAQLGYDVQSNAFDQTLATQNYLRNNDMNTPEGLRGLASVNPAAYRDYMKFNLDRQKALDEQQAAKTKNLSETQGIVRTAGQQLLANPTADYAHQLLSQVEKTTGVSLADDHKYIDSVSGLPNAAELIKQYALKHAVSSGTDLLAKPMTVDLHNQSVVGSVDRITGKFVPDIALQHGDTNVDKARIDNYRRDKSGEAPLQPLVPIVGPDGKIVLATRGDAIGKTPAAAMEGLPPKEIQRREATYPQQTQAIKAVESNADTFIKQLTTLADHPGLDGITGVVGSRTPNLTSEARAAQALYDQVVAKGGFSMLQAMRDASKTGGALGNLSDKEGAQLKSAFAAINQGQNPEDVRNAIKDAIAVVEGTKARMREAYDSTYEYRGQTKPSSKAPTVSNWRE